MPTERTAPAIAANREKWAARRAELADTFSRLAGKAADQAEQSIDEGDGANAKQMLVAAAIATDKHLLLTGEATSRHEVGRTADEQRLRVAELLTALEARRGGGALPA